MAFAPAVPGPARSPEARQPVAEALDVVSLEHQVLALPLQPGHGGGAAVLEGRQAGQGGIGIGQQAFQTTQPGTAHGDQAEGAAGDGEQGALPTALLQVVGQAPAADLGGARQQGVEAQGVLGIDQQVVDQQFFQLGIQGGRQLGEEHRQILLHPRLGQRLADTLGLDVRRIYDQGGAVLDQQVVQVQIGLPEALGMQPRQGGEGGAKQFVLRRRQGWLGGHLLPELLDAGRRLDKVEQQPGALPACLAAVQQRGSRRRGGRQQATALALAGELPARALADQQLGQHPPALPAGFADIALTGQHPEQRQHFQFATGQFDAQRQGWRAAGPGQLLQGHALRSLWRRRPARRWLQSRTAALSSGWSR